MHVYDCCRFFFNKFAAIPACICLGYIETENNFAGRFYGMESLIFKKYLFYFLHHYYIPKPFFSIGPSLTLLNLFFPFRPNKREENYFSPRKILMMKLVVSYLFRTSTTIISSSGWIEGKSTEWKKKKEKIHKPIKIQIKAAKAAKNDKEEFD